MNKAIYILVLLSSFAAAFAHGGQPTIRVQSVIPESAAAAAGIAPGDYIVQVAGETVRTADALKGVLDAHGPGVTVVLAIQREGETVELELTFGARPDGGASLGVQLEIELDPSAEGDAGEGTVACLDWIESTYRVDTMIEEFALESAEDYATIRECVTRDTQRMYSADAIKYCDNVFKVHCGGLDLLAEIGEAQVERCEAQLGRLAGVTPKQHRAWTTCAEKTVFERYSMSGETTDEQGCLNTFLKECGNQVEPATQPGFATCCSAATVDEKSCPMLDEKFSAGPCNDRSVCVNRLTGDWLDCTVLR